MQRSSPEGYRRRACSPRKRGEMGPCARVNWSVPMTGRDIRGCASYLFEGVEDGVAAAPRRQSRRLYVQSNCNDVQKEGATYGGRKNCSSSRYIPLAISVRRKNLPMRSRVALAVPRPLDTPARPEVGRRGALGRRVASLGHYPHGGDGGHRGGGCSAGGGEEQLSAREHRRRGLQGRRHGEGVSVGLGRTIVEQRANCAQLRRWRRRREALAVVTMEVRIGLCCGGCFCEELLRDYNAGAMIGRTAARDATRDYLAGGGRWYMSCVDVWEKQALNMDNIKSYYVERK